MNNKDIAIVSFGLSQLMRLDEDKEKELMYMVNYLCSNNNKTYDTLYEILDNVRNNDDLLLTEKGFNNTLEKHYPILMNKFWEHLAVKKKREKGLSVISFDELQELEDNTIYYIDRMFAASSVNMIFSPPAQGKSIISLYAAISLASGKTFFKQKVRQSGVLYIDKENNIDDIKNRAISICKGQDINMNGLNLNFVIREGDLLEPSFKKEVEDIIKERDIKVVFLDTIRRFGNFDENSSNDINQIYTQFFIPLMNKYKICFVFLHHTTKDGRYRGSGDLSAQVNTAYEVKKKNKKDSSFTIKAEKTRGNEVETINGNMYFENEYNTKLERDILVRLSLQTTSTDMDNDEEVKYSQLLKKIKDNFNVEEYYKAKDFRDLFDKLCGKSKCFEFLKWSTDNSILYKNHKGKYKVIDNSGSLQSRKGISNHIKDSLKLADVYEKSKLLEIYKSETIIDEVIEVMIKDNLIYEEEGFLKLTNE